MVQVSLPIGVPPKHYAELADRYRNTSWETEGAGTGIQRQGPITPVSGMLRYIPRRMLP